MNERIYYECKNCHFTCHKDKDLGKTIRCPKCHKDALERIDRPWTE